MSWLHYLCLSSCCLLPASQRASSSVAEPAGFQGVPTMELCRCCQGLFGGSDTKGWAQQLLETSGFNSSLKPQLSFGHQTTSLSSLQRTNPVAKLTLPALTLHYPAGRRSQKTQGCASHRGEILGSAATPIWQVPALLSL